jgi:uncharacterized protein (DUF1810 family)
MESSPDQIDEFDLERFVEAQNAGGTYAQALAELRQGRKVSHWMWFVFPQIAGLGQSPISRKFAIASLDEARAYLRHSVLGPRLRECASALAAHGDQGAVDVLGPVDAQKLRSSMTLFLRAAPDELVLAQLLDLFFDGSMDAATDQRL